jgi:hypothetical protein
MNRSYDPGETRKLFASSTDHPFERIQNVNNTAHRGESLNLDRVAIQWLWLQSSIVAAVSIYLRSASCVHFTAVFAVARDIESRMVRRTAHSILSPPHGRLKMIERFFIVNCARNGGRRADLDPGSLL